MQLMEETDSLPERAYTWTIRSLYTAAIALNLWYLMESYRETPEAKTLMARASKLWRRMDTPRRIKKNLRREETATVLEAWNIVEQAQRGES